MTDRSLSTWQDRDEDRLDEIYAATTEEVEQEMASDTLAYFPCVHSEVMARISRREAA